MKESEIIKSAKRGDSEAFGRLYDQYVSQIYRFIYFRVSSKTDAEDLTHQVFLKAWKSLKRYKEKGHPFSSWLYRIAQNTVVDFYRTSRSHQDIETLPEQVLSENPNIEDRVDQSIEVERIHSVIRQLDETSQSVLLMKFVDHLSNKEISVTLEKSEGAIRVIQHRALKQVRDLLENHGEEGNHTTTREA
ncbi:hypothetical protein CL629_04120 [bacterium]|nr:hypothetical protein [bacterium]